MAGKRAIVTGAAVGIGSAYARALAQRGVSVAVCDVRPEVDSIVEQLRGLGVGSVGWVADVSDPAAVRTVVDGAVQAFGGIDILVSNAGVVWQTHPDDTLSKTDSDFDRIVGTNLRGEFLFGRAVINQMIAQGQGGDIVNIATDHMVTCGFAVRALPEAAELPLGGCAATHRWRAVMDLYDASKWALNGLMYAWAKALRGHDIRVNSICMGATDSWMIRDFFGFPQNRADENAEQRETADGWMSKADSAQVLIELLEEGPTGRNAQNINLCLGRPVALEAPLPHRYVQSERVDA